METEVPILNFFLAEGNFNLYRVSPDTLRILLIGSIYLFSFTTPAVRNELKLTPEPEFRIAGRSARLGVSERPT